MWDLLLPRFVSEYHPKTPALKYHRVVFAQSILLAHKEDFSYKSILLLLLKLAVLQSELLALVMAEIALVYNI